MEQLKRKANCVPFEDCFLAFAKLTTCGFCQRDTVIKPVTTYSSASQSARVSTEGWVATSVSCPACGGSLSATPNNTRARDFLCSKCDDAFELKSKKSRFGKTIVDGAYRTLVDAIRTNNAPNLFLLQYQLPFTAVNLSVLPKRFLVEPMVIKRKPLSALARRAGWVGCNIDLSLIAANALIPCLVGGIPVAQSIIQSKWAETASIDAVDYRGRGWIAITLGCISRIGKIEFTLAEIYGQENIAARAYPDNRNIRAKLRQQLQVLRDLGAVTFEGRGRYRLLWT